MQDIERASWARLLLSRLEDVLPRGGLSRETAIHLARAAEAGILDRPDYQPAQTDDEVLQRWERSVENIAWGTLEERELAVYLRVSGRDEGYPLYAGLTYLAAHLTMVNECAVAAGLGRFVARLRLTRPIGSDIGVLVRVELTDPPPLSLCAYPADEWLAVRDDWSVEPGWEAALLRSRRFLIAQLRRWHGPVRHATTNVLAAWGWDQQRIDAALATPAYPSLSARRPEQTDVRPPGRPVAARAGGTQGAVASTTVDPGRCDKHASTIIEILFRERERRLSIEEITERTSACGPKREISYTTVRNTLRQLIKDGTVIRPKNHKGGHVLNPGLRSTMDAAQDATGSASPSPGRHALG